MTMHLTDQDIQKYIEIYQKEYGVLLDKKTAFEKGRLHIYQI